MKKLLTMIIVLCCMLSMMSIAAADYVSFAWPQDLATVGVRDAVLGSGIGDGETSQVFFVTSNGNAWLKLKQTKGTCQELSYTKLWAGFIGTAKEWGKYEIQVHHAESRTAKAYLWDDTYNNDTFKLEFPQKGHYYVYVRPFTSTEMTDSYLLDRFVGWENPPTWWVDDQRNCSCSNTSPFRMR